MLRMVLFVHFYGWYHVLVTLVSQRYRHPWGSIRRSRISLWAQVEFQSILISPQGASLVVKYRYLLSMQHKR